LSYRVQRSLTWIAKALGIDRSSARGAELDAPATVVDTIQPVVFAKGWQVLARENHETRTYTTAGVTTETDGDTPPDGEEWLVIAAAAFHTQAAAKTILIELQNIGGGPGVTLSQQVGVLNSVFTFLPRPILLVPGQRLAAVVVQAVGAGFNLNLRMAFAKLQPGEYIPGAPYG